MCTGGIYRGNEETNKLAFPDSGATRYDAPLGELCLAPSSDQHWVDLPQKLKNTKTADSVSHNKLNKYHCIADDFNRIKYFLLSIPVLGSSNKSVNV